MLPVVTALDAPKGRAITYTHSILASVVAGTAFGLAAWQLPSLVERKPFRWGGYACMVGSWILMGSRMGAAHDMGTAIVTVVSLAAGSLPWAGFLALALGANLRFLVSWAISDAQLTVRPMYSTAEAAEARGEHAAAAAAYAKIADEHPADPEPRRRMAEALLKAGQPRNAVEALRQAVRIEDKPGEQFLIVLRLSEVLADDCADLRGAVSVLETHLVRHPEAHGAGFAKERIARLKARMN